MHEKQFLDAYNASRNGANEFYKHSLVRKFIYSDGVHDCAIAGCYWLLDILATELPKQFAINKDISHACLITVIVRNSKASINAEFVDGAIAWSKAIDFTDLPAGDWKFYIAYEDGLYRMILLSEY